MIKYYYEDKYKKELQTKIINIFLENGKCFLMLEILKVVVKRVIEVI